MSPCKGFWSGMRPQISGDHPTSVFLWLGLQRYTTKPGFVDFKQFKHPTSPAAPGSCCEHNIPLPSVCVLTENTIRTLAGKLGKISSSWILMLAKANHCIGEESGNLGGTH